MEYRLDGRLLLLAYVQTQKDFVPEASQGLQFMQDTSEAASGVMKVLAHGSWVKMRAGFHVYDDHPGWSSDYLRAWGFPLDELLHFPQHARLPRDVSHRRRIVGVPPVPHLYH